MVVREAIEEYEKPWRYKPDVKTPVEADLLRIEAYRLYYVAVPQVVSKVSQLLRMAVSRFKLEP